jgi:Ser-tRNA(Ala) deacylase AlaX
MGSKPTSETFSRSSTSSASGPEDIRAHSAVHVLSGAITATIGPRPVVEIGSGRIVISSDEELTQEDLSRVEAAANSEVGEDAEFLEFEMERAEAEAHFGKGIYDLAASNEEGAMVRIVRIPEWDASICSRKHVESTADIGAIEVKTAKFDDTRKHIELEFILNR